MSASIAGLALFRVIERLGKGFRGPPRDAWLAALADPATRGYSFGVHKALDKAGAVLGPLLAYALLSWAGETEASYRALFWAALGPALLAVIVLTQIEDRLGDWIGRSSIVMLGYALYAGINIALMLIDSAAAIVTLFAVYGICYAIEEAQTKAFIADLETERRASAAGLYHFVTGAIYLPASLLAGGL